MRLLILLFIISFANDSIAQSAYRDQLQKRLESKQNQKEYLSQLGKKRTTNSRLAVIYYELGQLYRSEAKIDSAEFCYRKALKYAFKISDKNQEIGMSYKKIGMVLSDRGEFDSALIYIERSIPYFTDQKLVASSLNGMGLMNKYKSNPDVAINNFLSAGEIYREIKDTMGHIIVLSNVGALYRQLKDYEKGREYLIRGLDLAGDNEAYNRGKFLCESNLASIYMSKKNYPDAIKLYNELIAYSKKSKQYAKLIVNQSNLAGCYAEMGEDKEALNQYLSVLKTMDDLGLEKNKEAILTNIAFSHEDLGNYAEALRYYHRALKFARTNNIALRYATIYEGLSSVYLKLDIADSSLFYKDLQIAVKDSLDNVEKEKKMMELEAQHRNKELDLDLKDAKKALDSAEDEKSFFETSFVYALLIVLVALFIVVALTIRYRRKKRLAKVLSDRNAESQDEISSLTDSLDSKEEEIERLIEENQTQKLAYPPNLAPLTEREKEVLLGVKDGLKDQEIAERLFISITTVRTHLRKAYVKIDVRNRAEAISFISKYHF